MVGFCLTSAIFACSYEDTIKKVAFPYSGKKTGSFAIMNPSDENNRPIYVDAHNHDIECLEMDFDGTIVASASKKGTIIRLYKVSDGKPLQEFRRGIDNAKIMSLCFDYSGTMLGVSSDSGTVHLYKVNKEAALEDLEDFSRKSIVSKEETSTSDNLKKNKKSRLAFLKKAVKYFKHEWSSLQLKVDEKIVFVNFDSESNRVLVYKPTGKFWTHEFQENDKKVKKIDLQNYIRLLQMV